MSTQDLIQLNMTKDEESRWQCPVLTKPFSDHTKIVAVLQPPNRKKANVYSWEAYQELNVKANNYEDLLSGVKFHKKKDVLVLFDPNDDTLNAKRDINTFHHVTHSRQLLKNNTQSSSDNNVRHSVTATRILEKLKKQGENDKKRKATELSATATTTTASAAGSSTYTTYYNVHGQPLQILAQDVTGVAYTARDLPLGLKRGPE